MNKRYLTFDEIKTMTGNLCRQVSDSNFHPDIIVGITRGGLLPAVMMSHFFKVPMTALQWNSRDHTELGNESCCWLPEDAVAGKNILIVDDIIDSGQTIAEIREDWQKSVREQIQWGQNVKVAALQKRFSCSISIDYFVERIADEAWQVYPWEEWI
jgi:hypoxanthine phosphoribosyltransferase